MNKLNVIYEDNHIIVVEKKPNILSQKDITKDLDMISIVKAYLKEKYNKPGNVYLGLVHRLDRPVGGLMVFAKTSKAANRLSKSIKEHKFQKGYIAVIDGIVENKEDTFIDYLKREKNGNTVVSTKDEGKYAELKYKVVQINKRENKTLVKIELKTGRHHQIRVQFASRNYPLCGDQRYGKKDKTQLALFSYYLGFCHPVTKEWMELELYPSKGDYWTMFTL